MVIFPLDITTFLGAVFPTTGLPDLPGRGNTLEPVKPPTDMRAILSGLNLSAAVTAQLQRLDPAKQREILLQYARRAEIHRQQQQQQQRQAPSQPMQVQDIGAMGNATAAGNTGMSNFVVSVPTFDHRVLSPDGPFSPMRPAHQDPWPVDHMAMVAGR